MNAKPHTRAQATSLGAKATAAVIALLVVFAAVMASIFIFSQQRSSLANLHEKSVSFAQNLAFNANYALLSRDTLSLERLISGVQNEMDVVEVTVADSLGVVVVSTRQALLDSVLELSGIDPDSSGWISLGEPRGYRAVAPVITRLAGDGGDESMLFSPAAPLAHPGRRVIGWAVVDVSLERVRAELTEGMITAVLITALMVLIASLLIVISVRRAVAPLHLLAGATREIAGGKFGSTLAVDRGDELGVLTASFNEMSLKLKQSQDEVKELNRELETRVAESTTELKTRYQELESVCNDLRHQDSAKDDFLSLVSHEFRTPLGSIQIFSEMLLKGLDTSETNSSDLLVTIINNCKRLTRLINDVLDISRIEAGRMEFHLEEFDLKEAIYETLFSLKPIFENNFLRCNFQAPVEKVLIRSDRDKIIQVLTNVFANAAKFSPQGQLLDLTLALEGGEAIMQVRDYGKGIRQEDIPKVFDKFCQLEKLQPQSEGSGLGMSISKLIVESLGGRIRIDSELGKGTSVFIILPL